MTSTTALAIDQRVAFVSYGIGTASAYTGLVVGFVSEARDFVKIEITGPVSTGRVFTVSVRNIYTTVREAKAVAAATPTMTPGEMSHAHGYGRGRYTGD